MESLSSEAEEPEDSAVTYTSGADSQEVQPVVSEAVSVEERLVDSGLDSAEEQLAEALALWVYHDLLVTPLDQHLFPKDHPPASTPLLSSSLPHQSPAV